ncbi:MAG TPA: GGDEF domain-containing protein [bacterium]|nr:GGDEF domain-containing protein [bacterium]
MINEAMLGEGFDKTLPDRFGHYNNWTIDAMTNLVNFAAITLEPAPAEDIPRHIVDFLSRPFFGLSFAGLFRFDLHDARWVTLASFGATATDIEMIPTFEGNMLLEEEREIYSFFTILDEAFLVLVTRDTEGTTFSPYECSFMSLFSTLISSFYQMKKLAKQVEERIVEMSTLSASSKLIAGLKENTITLEEAFLELHDSLSLTGMVLAICDPATEKLHVAAARGIDIGDWDALLDKIYTDERHFPEEWELFAMFDEHLMTYGAVLCRLTKQNPTLYAIQRRVLDYTVSQVTTILSQRQFHNEAITDPLTGLSNRRHLMKVLKDRVRAARLEPLTKLSVAMVDIDRFKLVNDTYGHPAGDEVLKAVAGAISAALRGTDLAGRYGGEEFLVIMQAGRKGAYHVSERIRRNIAKLRVKTGDKTISLTASIGYATCTGVTASPEELIARADAYLYEAKEAGRDRVVGDKPEEEPK